MKMHTSINCWIITEGMKGTENQCLGLVNAMGIEPTVKKIKLKQPWQVMSPWLYSTKFNPIGNESDLFAPPWPDLIVAAGRKSVAPALWVKEQAGEDCVLIQIQNPYVSPSKFDFVITPQHDYIEGDNVIKTVAGLHNICQEKLDEARESYKNQFSKLPEPRVAVLIGGDSKHHTLTPDSVNILARQLNQLAHDGYGLMVTVSRRTGAENEKILRDTLTDKNIYFWDDTGENPYAGMLAWADVILVTEDSVSMTSEAVSTGKAVYIIKMEGNSDRLDRFHETLQKSGITRIFEGKIEQWQYEPPRDTEKVAKKIIDYLGKRKQTG